MIQDFTRLTPRSEHVSSHAPSLGAPVSRRAAMIAARYQEPTKAKAKSRKSPAKKQVLKARTSTSRSDSKQAQLIKMLERHDGATIEEMVKKLGWKSHTVRGAISGVVKKKLSLDVTSDKTEG